MNIRPNRTLLVLAAAGAMAVPAAAQARQGADDPAGHVRHAQGADDAVRHEVRHRAHRRHRHHVAQHARHGADDGPNHG